MIAVIEDEPLSAEAVGQWLKFEDMDYEVYSSPDQFLEALKEGIRPDLMLIDIRLPGMSGLQLMDILRARRETERTPAIAVTAQFSEELAQTALQRGFQDCIRKPFDGTMLINLIRRYRGQ